MKVGVFLLSLLVYCVMCKEESAKHGNPIHDAHHKDGVHNNKYDHEAVLGSEDDVEEFSELSPEESKKKLELIFVRMDVNKDNHVDAQELEHWILKSFANLNLEDTKSKMKTDDKDENGVVTWEEFLESTYGMSEEELKDYKENDVDDDEAKKVMAKSLVYDKRKFTAADENGDGQLDVDEATAFLHPYDYPRMSEVETDRILSDYDKNDDGKISVDEYISNPVFGAKEEEDLIGERENFLFNDGDGDGELNKEEILKWVSPDLERIAKEEAAHLIQETDKNKDGQLTVEEVKEEYELWVGSEATEYGDWLHERDEL